MSTAVLLDGRAEVRVRLDRDRAATLCGAPAVVREDGWFYMSYLVTVPSGRGWRTAIDRSSDGVNFKRAWSFDANCGGVQSLGRSCLRRLDLDGSWHLWASWQRPDGIWVISHCTSDRPWFNLHDASPALTLHPARARGGVLDPVVVEHAGRLLMFMVGRDSALGPALTYRAESENGAAFHPSDTPVISAVGWRTGAQARLSALMPLDDGRIVVWVEFDLAFPAGPRRRRMALATTHDPLEIPEVGRGDPRLAWSWERVSPQARSYPAPVRVGNELWVYHERGGEILLVKVPMADVMAALA